MKVLLLQPLLYTEMEKEKEKRKKNYKGKPKTLSLVRSHDLLKIDLSSLPSARKNTETTFSQDKTAIERHHCTLI